MSKSVGGVKKAMMTYGPNGQSRGICTVIFNKRSGAAEAAKELDDVKIDGRLLKVEVILAAKDAPPPPPVKSLSERMS